MPYDPNQLWRLLYGPRPAPADGTDPSQASAPQVIGGPPQAPDLDPALTAGGPGVPQAGPVQPDQGTNPQPAPASPDTSGGPQVSVGQAYGQPIPNGVTETASGEPVPASASAQPAAPPGVAPATREDPFASAQRKIEGGVDADDPLSIALGGYQMGALAAERKARETGTALASYNKQLADLQAQQVERDRQLQAEASEQTAQVQAAAERLRQSSPDPSVLWGSQGSWGRAIVSVIAAGAMGPSAQAVVQNVINMGMRDQAARFDDARNAVVSSQASQAAKLAQLRAIDDSFAATRLALAQSLQGTVAGINNNVMPAQTKAALLDTLSKTVSKIQTDVYDQKLKDAQTQEALAKAGKLSGAGAGGVGGGVNGSVRDPFLRFGKDADRVLVLDPGLFNSSGGTRGYMFDADKEDRDQHAKDLGMARAFTLNASQLRVQLQKHGASLQDAIAFLRTPNGKSLVSKYQTSADEYTKLFGTTPSTRSLEIALNAISGGKDISDAQLSDITSGLDTVLGTVENHIRGEIGISDQDLTNAGVDPHGLLPRYNPVADDTQPDHYIDQVVKGTAGTGGIPLSPDEILKDSSEAQSTLSDEYQPVTDDPSAGFVRPILGAPGVNPMTRRPPEYRAGIDKMLDARADAVRKARRDLVNAKGKKAVEDAKNDLRVAQDQLKATIAGAGGLNAPTIWARYMDLLR